MKQGGLKVVEGIIGSKSNDYLMTIRSTYDRMKTEEEFIKNVKDEVYTMSFKIEGNNVGCIDISYTNIYNIRGMKIPVEYAVLNNIKSDESCNISGNLEAGKGTKDMLFTALQTVKKVCSWVKYIELTDVSKKDCRKGEATTGVSLSCYYIALYGKTW